MSEYWEQQFIRVVEQRDARDATIARLTQEVADRERVMTQWAKSCVLLEAQADTLRAELATLKARVEGAKAQLEVIIKAHFRVGWDHAPSVCYSCSEGPEDYVEWPCMVYKMSDVALRALTGEGET